jgi:hypothetical protein
MNDFQAKNIHAASEYLQNKLNLFKKEQVYAEKTHENSVYVIEEKKESMLKRFVHSIFKS